MSDIKKAILVNVTEDKDSDKVLIELAELAKTAGYLVVGKMIQRKHSPDKVYYIGKGKLSELKELADELKANTIIFDNDINGSQFHNLEEALDMDVIDRATLILEIFSNRAASNEGKLQVRLAKLKHFLPRILGQGAALSRQGGGGGGGGGARRGAGEQKQELDKRTIRKEIRDLEEKIEKLTEERRLRRSRRQKNAMKVVSLVGYTNSGKSTLMNNLTKANVLEEDKLFATLDPVARKLWISQGQEFLLVDTVGFISRLPHSFIDAFKSTLEETVNSDLILHVVDLSSENLLFEYDVVCEVLNSLGVSDTPILVIGNKCDKIDGDITLPFQTDNIVISAKKGLNIEQLKDKIVEILFGKNFDNEVNNEDIDA